MLYVRFQTDGSHSVRREDTHRLNNDIPDSISLVTEQAMEHDLRIRVTTFPNDAYSWFLLGRNLRMSSKCTEAERALRRAVTIDPNQVQFWLELATVLDQLGFHTDAQAIRQNAGEKGALQANIIETRRSDRISVCIDCDKHTYYGCTQAGRCDKISE